MYLIGGLGNPGRQYEATRHNMGFDVIDKLVEEYQIPQGGVKFNAMYGKGIIGGQPALLMKPLSYMNLSGGPVREMANYFKIDPETEMIMESKISFRNLVHRNLSVSKLVWEQNHRDGILQIMFLEDLEVKTVNSLMRHRTVHVRQ